MSNHKSYTIKRPEYIPMMDAFGTVFVHKTKTRRCSMKSNTQRQIANIKNDIKGLAKKMGGGE